MELNLGKILGRVNNSEFVKNFIKELKEDLENNNESRNEVVGSSELNQNEELEFEKKQFEFLQNYFKEQLSNQKDGEIFIVTDKFENDNEYNRYKVTQYKNNLECKYIALKENLPEDVKLRDVVRKINGKYIYDEKETTFVKDSINKIKQEIIENRA